MNAMKPCNTDFQIPYVYNHSTNGTGAVTTNNKVATMGTSRRKLKPAVIKASNTGGSQGKDEKRSFLSIEEAGMVEMSGLISHEKFLCRLTVRKSIHLPCAKYQCSFLDLMTAYFYVNIFVKYVYVYIQCRP